LRGKHWISAYSWPDAASLGGRCEEVVLLFRKTHSASKQIHGVHSRDVFLFTLQAADRAHAQAGSLGQILLCEPGCPPMLLE